MVIYEVNLTLEDEIAADFHAWLMEHVAEMLTFDGFRDAKLFRVEDESFHRLTVWYTVESRDALDRYFNGAASRMREDGLKRFGGRFQATRRILRTMSDQPRS